MNKKIVFLENGNRAELLGEIKDGKNILYGVNEILDEDGEECKKLVNNIYDRYEDVPIYRKKLELEKEIEKLKNKIEILEEAEDKFKSVYNPVLKIGDTVYYVDEFSKEVATLVIREIDFRENEETSYCTYYCDGGGSFRELGEYYFANKEDAEKKLKYIIDKHNSY